MPLYSRPPVTSALWSGSVFQAGGVLEGVEVIRQRLYVVINTPLGSDPLRPLFGTDIYKYADRPLQIAAAGIKLEVTDAITIWVPEVKLEAVTYKITPPSAVEFEVRTSWQGKALPPVTFGLSRGVFAFGGMKGMLIADAVIPYNRDGLNYLPVLMVNDGESGLVAATPALSGSGYATMADALAAVKSNWSGYGDWGMGKDVLVCYVKSNYRNANLRVQLV